MPSTKQLGFTLIEMIGVLAVIAILAGLITPKVFDTIKSSRYRQAEGTMHSIQAALLSFAKDTGVWAGRHEGLYYLYGPGTGSTGVSATAMCGGSGASANLADYLINNTKNYRGWQGPYLDGLPEDPWGYRYAVNVGGLYGMGGGNVWILSPGPDGTCDTLRTAEAGANDDVALMVRRIEGSSTAVASTQAPKSATPAPQQASAAKVTPAIVQGADILTLTPAEIATLTPEQIAMMSAADYGKFSAAQKAALTQPQLDERVLADGARALKLWQFDTITVNQAKYLTSQQIATVPHDWWFNKIPQASRDAMTQAQIQAFIPNAFKNGRVGTLTATQRNWLTTKQITGLTQDNFQSLSQSQFAQVTPQQIATVPHDWWFNKIPQASRDAMTQAQVQALIPNVFKNGGVSTLTATQRNWLTPTQITGLTQYNFKSLSLSQFAQVTPQQIATIPNNWWFNQMPQASRDSMTQAQVNAIPTSVYAKIKPSLTAQQQSWRP